MNDLDLEDIESRLYSEVYHGIIDETDQNPVPNPTPTNFSKPSNDMRRPAARYFGPWSPGAKFQNKNTPLKSNHSRPPIHKDSNKSDGFYSKDPGRPQKSDIPINQVVTVSPTKSIPVVYMSGRQARKAHWKAKVLERKRQKRSKRPQRKTQILKDSAPDAVITLSDSDEDSCVVIEKKWPMLSVVDSDEEKKKTLKNTENNITLKNEPKNVLNESLADDVIFVEPAPIEVINLDEEFVACEESGQNVETASSSSDNTITNSPRKEKVQQLHQERKELLNTPDSASNDFMNNSGLELHGRNFNFSLHGSDFNSGEFSKPAARNETCETESSSSTTDVNSVNLMKTVVFNEVDFPKEDIFSENNLESFGNFITPLRNNTAGPAVQSSPLRVVEVHNQNRNQNYSDSSSESELEDSQYDKDVKKLPELSPMHKSSPQVTKKSKKLGSKFDLLDPSTDNIKQKNAKKKKKNKKKKSSECSMIDNLENVGVIDSSVENNVIEGESSVTQTEQTEFENQLRQKKRRSSQMESSVLENQPKKKIAANAKEDVLLQNLESGENLTECLQSKNMESKELSISVESGVQFEKELTKICRAQVSTMLDGSITEKIKQTNNETAEGTMLENTLNEKSCSQFEQIENSTFEGLVVIDEINQETSMILSSDSESVLSALQEEQDIQINCEEHENDIIEGNNDFDNFSVKNLQLAMSNDPSLWKILESDRTPSRKSKGRRCNRCRQFGHMAIRCPNKVEVKCALCGGSGHYEPRCPNKICTQCGQRSPYSTTYCSSCFKYRNHVCQLCSTVGHSSNTCPDLWRRYHLTTTDGPLTKSEGPGLKEKNQLWCSGCAQSGHLEHSCRFYKSIYPASDPFIKSYEDIYKEKETDSNRIEPVPLLTQNYRVDNFGRNYLLETVNQMNFLGYNNQNTYGQINHQLLNPYMDGVFVANQQNFFPPGPANMYQLPQNNFPGNQNQILFENPLPTFISFDTPNPTTTYNEIPTAPTLDFGADRYFKNQTKAQSRTVRRNNSMFFSSSGVQLQHFLNDELHRLSKLSVLSNKVVKELRKRPVPKRDNGEKEEYYETLNMLLFGVFTLIDGKLHLERLKKFKRDRLHSKVANATRRRLHTSYCYIFGRDKHYGVDYNDLLRRI